MKIQKNLINLLTILPLLALLACNGKNSNSDIPLDESHPPCIDCNENETPPLGQRITRTTPYTFNTLWYDEFPESEITRDERYLEIPNSFAAGMHLSDAFTQAMSINGSYCNDFTESYYYGFSDELSNDGELSVILIRITANNVVVHRLNTSITFPPLNANATITEVSNTTYDCTKGILYAPGDPNSGSANADSFIARNDDVAIGKLDTYSFIAFSSSRIRNSISGLTQSYQTYFREEYKPLTGFGREMLTLQEPLTTTMYYTKDGTIESNYTTTEGFFSQNISGDSGGRVYISHEGITGEKLFFTLVDGLQDQLGNPKNCVHGIISENMSTQIIHQYLGCN
ncbi:MAG: hypothetical protein CME65_14570 [Halobacteriovoraceae bacterium]|nr:hypothetical protein [Halobacteriovoraceae bacterium]|tara:strand:- start:8677 stop:9702 length:1026 start_codon:yes stop_codon:yes gene_type:complete